ncbi:MAG: hypothetical protein HC917_27000 [Richelia sp. SM2_1_7]|nr:hypothetical protein [Richelia sp. SM2_1_7]
MSSQEPDCSEMLVMLENSAKRGASIVKQILTFARGNEGKRTVLQVKHLLKILNSLLKEHLPNQLQFKEIYRKTY